jgi:hypothetical protein
MGYTDAAQPHAARDPAVESKGRGNVGSTGKASPLPNLHGHMPALDWVSVLAILMVLLVHFIGSMLPTNSVERAIV